MRSFLRARFAPVFTAYDQNGVNSRKVLTILEFDPL
jgi:hypothetical protein